MSEMKRLALELREAREQAAVREAALRTALAGDGPMSNMRKWATRMGISPQFACDIKKGRKGISDNLVDKILKAEEEVLIAGS